MIPALHNTILNQANSQSPAPLTTACLYMTTFPECLSYTPLGCRLKDTQICIQVSQNASPDILWDAG